MPVTTHPHVLRNQTTNPFGKCQPPPYSSLTTSCHVLWIPDRKVLRGHSGSWVWDQKTGDVDTYTITSLKFRKTHFYLLTSLSSAFVLNILTKHIPFQFSMQFSAKFKNYLLLITEDRWTGRSKMALPKSFKRFPSWHFITDVISFDG